MATDTTTGTAIRAGTRAGTTTWLYLGGPRLQREALRASLSRSGVRLVPVVSLQEAFDHLDAQIPDGMLVDTEGLDEEGAAEMVTALLRKAPDLKVGAVSGTSSPGLPAALIRAGATAYLSKDTRLGEFRYALARMLEGDLVVDPFVARPLLGFLDGTMAEGSPNGEGPHLTAVERRVLALAAEGKVSKQIARELGLSPLTVKNHLSRIRNRLGAFTTTQAVGIALRTGLIE